MCMVRWVLGMVTGEMVTKTPATSVISTSATCAIFTRTVLSDTFGRTHIAYARVEVPQVEAKHNKKTCRKKK